MGSKVVYKVLCYEPGVPDDERSWCGEDVSEAMSHLIKLRAKYPDSPTMLSVEAHYAPMAAEQCASAQS